MEIIEWENFYTRQQINDFIDIMIIQDQIREFKLKFWKKIMGNSTNKE